MAQPKHIPRNAVVVERYQELDSFIQAFAAGHLRFLMVVGPAGTGKSRAMRVRWLAGLHGWMGMQPRSECTASLSCIRTSRSFSMMSMLSTGTPTGFGYSSSYANRTIAFTGLVLRPSVPGARGLPRTFTTSSPVAIIANRWSTMNADVAALEIEGA